MSASGTIVPRARVALVLIALGLEAVLPAWAGDRIPPNELGRVMILEYHRIDHPEARWTRLPENFRQDLQRLWERGYRLIPLGDLVEGKVGLPRGSTPVVLTFDDSSPGQFRYVDRGGTLVIDPDCAVGILEVFDREHPGFGRAATFYVLPGADPPNRLFNQPELATRKLEYLATHGYEIGNHTLWHANLSKYPEEVVRKQIATAQEWIQRHVPGYRPRTLALPMGAFPKDTAWATSGQVGTTVYRHEAILMVAGGTAPSPHARSFDPLRLPRIQAIDADLNHWIGYFDKNPGERYVSDGDPATITIPAGRASALRPGGPARVIERP